MNCQDAHQEMLIADPGVLDTSAGPERPLHQHLAECARCRSIAGAIVAGTTAAGPLLDRRRRAPARARTVRRIAWGSALPIAAATLWAVVVHERPARPLTVSVMRDRPPAARHVSVDLHRGQQAVVIKTADPHVTLVWLSSGVSQ